MEKEAYKKMQEMLILETQELSESITRFFIFGILVGMSLGIMVVMIIQQLLGKL